ncbi:MAG: hypothetical protein KDB79_06580, partial [Acidobacteria bacterium]|nr:hypothetical protein [Acidobacteriota bacterium]
AVNDRAIIDGSAGADGKNVRSIQETTDVQIVLFLRIFLHDRYRARLKSIVRFADRQYFSESLTPPSKEAGFFELELVANDNAASVYCDRLTNVLELKFQGRQVPKLPSFGRRGVLFCLLLFGLSKDHAFETYFFFMSSE